MSEQELENKPQYNPYDVTEKTSPSDNEQPIEATGEKVVAGPDQIDDDIFNMNEEEEQVTEESPSVEEEEETPYVEKIYEVKEDHVFTQPEVKRKFVTKDKKLTDDELESAISIVNSTQETLLKNLEKFKGLGDDTSEEEVARFIKWVKAIDKAQNNFLMSDDQLIDATTRPGSRWRNMINIGSQEKPEYRGPIVDRKGRNPNDKNDTKSMALSVMTSILNVGSPCYIFLYHTGIWLQLRTPTAAEFALLDEALVSEKVEYGALTRGLIFSNDYVIIRKIVYDFVLDHVTFSTAPSDDPEYLRSIIKVTDIDEMMRGIMQTRYPDGYPYIESCTSNPNQCTHQIEGIIDLREISWADESMLTDYQLSIMKATRRRITEEEIERYQQEFASRQNNRIVFKPAGSSDDESEGVLGEDDNILNGVVLTIETPSLERDRDYGTRLVYGLKHIVENIFKEKFDTEARNKRLNELVAVSYFKVYGAWVKSIEIYEAGQVILREENEGELNKLFDYLSSDANHVERFIKTIKEYISNTIVQVVGLKNYECPACGGKSNTKPGNHYLILPMDMLSTFFILVQSSVRRSIR